MREELSDMLRFVEADGHLLRQRPSLIFPLATAQHVDSFCFKAAFERAEQGRAAPFWLSWINKPRARSSRSATMLGHDRDVTLISFLNDGVSILTGSDDGSQRLWDARSGALQQIVARHSRHATCHDCSPDGTRLASGSADRTVVLADTNGSEVAVLKGHELRVTACTFSMDSRLLATTDGKSILVWDAFSGQRRVELTGIPGWVRALRFEPDSRGVVGMTNGPTLTWWDLTGAISNVVQVFNGAENWSIEHAAISEDGRSAVGLMASGSVALWNRDRGVVIRSRWGFSYRGCEVVSFAFARDGSRVAVATRPKSVMTNEDLLDRTLIVYRAPDLSEMHFERQSGEVRSLAFSNNADMLASGANDQTLRVWDLKNGVQLAVFSEWGEISSGLPTNAITSCAFSNDSQSVAGGSHGVAKVWRLPDADLETQPAPQHPIESCLVAPHGKTFLTLRQCESPLEVCDVKTTQTIYSLGHTRPSWINPVVFTYSPLGDSVLLGEPKDNLKIWDIASGELRHEFNPQSSGSIWSRCCFSPMGTHIAAVKNWQFQTEAIEIWHVASQTLVNRLDEIKGKVTSLLFSPKGDLLLWGTDIGLFSLWDINDNKLSATTFEGASEGVGACFSPDGSWIATVVRQAIEETVSLNIWDPNFRKLGSIPVGTSQGTRQIDGPVISSDGNYVLCVAGGTLRGWNLSPQQNQKQDEVQATAMVEAPDIRSARFSPSSFFLAAVTGLGSVIIYSRPGWEQIAEWIPESSRITSVSWINNERILVTMADGTIGLLELKTSRQHRQDLQEA